ncbi:MAG: basic amino acid ABC transporter substrate-binding protein [Schwartzia sp.]|nr:basic amino acid ABC transporter substrate-binding protein [Schwartzia sp. (in: firmicutes)]
MKRAMLMCLALVMALSMLVTGCGGGSGEKKKDDAKASTEKVLRIGTNADFAPFEFQDVDGKNYEGFDMDLIRAVAKEMKYKADIQNINFDGLIPAMESGNLDVIISGMTINDERKQKVNFSDPYYKSGLTIVVKNDNKDIKTFKDLKGKRVAVQIGTTSAKEVKKIEGVEVKELNSSADTFMELKAGGVDAVVNDKPVNDTYIKTTGGKEVRALDELLTSEDYGIAISKKNPEMLKEVNAALKKLHENGEYDKIYKKWFGEQAKK